MNKSIVIRTQFGAFHCWPEAPEEVSFLRNPHRHVFFIVVKWGVNHNDRDKEFLMLKKQVDNFIYNSFGKGNLGRMSCEDIADKIHDAFPDSSFVSVFEDNENGVEAYYD